MSHSTLETAARLGAVLFMLSVPGCAADSGGPPSKGREALAMSDPEDVRLGSAPVTVRVPVPPAAAERLRSAAAGSGRLWLVVEGLQLLRPGVYHQVYLNLPEGAEPDPQGPRFVGNLSLFGAPRDEPIEKAFDVTEKVRALGESALQGDLRVTFVPGNPEAAGEAGPFLSFRRVKLVERGR
jgi:hypothetical protein